jgi:stage V sporulation protein AE
MDYFWAFVIGGLLCVIGQLLISYTRITSARVLVIFVTSGVVLTALGLYEPLVKFAKNGATVPLTGFGYNLTKGAMDGAKDGFLAALGGGIKNTAAGITAAVAFGYIVSLIFSPKSKR